MKNRQELYHYHILTTDCLCSSRKCLYLSFKANISTVVFIKNNRQNPKMSQLTLPEIYCTWEISVSKMCSRNKAMYNLTGTWQATKKR